MSLRVPYATGYRAEREAKKMLEKEGYHVIRAAGSHGVFDLAAFSKKDVRLIQLKVISFDEKRVFQKEQRDLKNIPV
jgi:Holliday junction resolvase